MAGRVSAADGARVRRWAANWQIVGEVQEDLARAAPPPDPVACLDRGLSLIAFTRPDSPHPDRVRSRTASARSVWRTWRRLRASYGR